VGILSVYKLLRFRQFIGTKQPLREATATEADKAGTSLIMIDEDMSNDGKFVIAMANGRTATRSLANYKKITKFSNRLRSIVDFERLFFYAYAIMMIVVIFDRR
jgi:hypothetical protein